MPGRPRKKAAGRRKAAAKRKAAATRKAAARRKSARTSEPTAKAIEKATAKAARRSGARCKGAARRRGVTLDGVRACAMALPGVEEGTSYGTPAWRVRGKLFARLHDSGEALVVRIDLDDREVALQADPKTFFITDHYTGHPMMLVRLDHVTRAGLVEALEESWRRVAPRRLLAELDASRA